MRNIDKGIHVFVLCSGLVLVAAALVRFIICAGDSQLLLLPDPLILVQVRYAVAFVGLAEFVAGWVCLFGKSLGIRLGLLTWLMTSWAMYRASLACAETNINCSCLGTLTDPLQLAHGLVGHLAALLPILLFIGTYTAMFLVWILHRAQRRSHYLKVVCPGCAGHIEFPPNGILWKIACPHCGDGVQLQNLPQIR